jgi:hypothetical protein
MLSGGTRQRIAAGDDHFHSFFYPNAQFFLIRRHRLLLW